jgi:hypothetical protein
MAHKLSDEVLDMILAPALAVLVHVVEEEASWIDASPSRSLPHTSCYSLLVCKRWLRVGTPHFYTSVIISSKEQASSLAQTLSKYPEFGKFIKNLRIDGSYAKLGKILTSCSNLRLLVLHLEISSRDAVDGLCSGLTTINPKELMIYDSGFQIKKISKVLTSLSTAIRKWFNLVRHYFPL